MRLYWSTRSPFARKVTLCAHELGLADRIALVPAVVGMSQPNREVMRSNPLNKIPTLLLDDGRALYDSVVIIAHLDRLAGSGRVIPAAWEAKLEALRRHALGSGLIDLLVLWRNERDRPDGARSEAHLAAYAVKADAALDALEGEADALAALPLDIGHVAVGCALGYMDFRFGTRDWRPGRHRLAAWHAALAARPSYRATLHREG